MTYTITDDNLDTCWYEYDGSNNTFSCSTGVLSTEYFNYSANENSLTVWANDTAGNTNSSTATFNYYILENSQTYNSNSVEGFPEEYIVNVSYDSSKYFLSGDIYYNGTTYAGTPSGTGNTRIISRTITTPSITTERDFEFYWRIGLTNSTGTKHVTSLTNNQTITPTNMSLFGSPHTVAFINFTAYDEKTLAQINATLETTFIYKAKGGEVQKIFSYSDTAEDKGEWSFSFNPSDKGYSLDAILEVNNKGYYPRFYNFKNLELSNDTTTFNLYLLNTTDSTSYIIRVKDEDYLPYVGVEVWIQRYYPSTNTWRTIEIDGTNEDGEIVGHLYSEEAKYRFKIYEEGVLIHTTEETLVYCSSIPCTIEIIVARVWENVLDDYKITGLTATISYITGTQDVEYTYSDTSGKFTQARLYVFKQAWGESYPTIICNKTSTSSTAVLSCDLTGSVNGSYIASGYLTRTDMSERKVVETVFKKAISVVEEVGLEGVLWSIFLLIGIMMLGVYKPSLGIIFGAMGVLLLGVLNLVSIPVTAVVAVIGIAIVLLVGVRKE